MNLVVIRKFDSNGLEQFALINNGITLCSFTSDTEKLQRILFDTTRFLQKNTTIGFFDLYSKETKTLDVAALRNKIFCTDKNKMLAEWL